MRVFRTRGWRTKGKCMCAGEKTAETNYKKKERSEALGRWAGSMQSVCRGSVEMLPVTHPTCSRLMYRGREVCGCSNFCTVMTPHCLLRLVTGLKWWHFLQALKYSKRQLSACYICNVVIFFFMLAVGRYVFQLGFWHLVVWMQHHAKANNSTVEMC